MSSVLLIAMCAAVAGGLMRGFAGVGAGMLMAPIFLRLFGPVDTVAILILMEIVVSVQLLPSVWRAINWRLILPMAGVATLFMPLGTYLLVIIDPKLLAYIVAVLVIVFALVLMKGWRYTGRKPLPATLGVGAVSGVLMALTSIGNPPVMIYLLSSQDSAEVNRANFAGYFALILLALIGVMSVSGLITSYQVTTAIWILPVFMLATWVGAKLFRKANEKLYRRVAFLILLGAGIYALFQ